MASLDLTAWLRAAHPFREPRSMLEAQRAGRLGAVALLAHMVGGIALIAWMGANPALVMPMATPELEQMAGGVVALQVAMPIAAVLASLFTLLVYGLIAWVQWSRMTRFIPMAALVLTGWGAFMNVAAILTGGMAENQAGPLPAWLVVTDWIATVALVVLSGAALRGATYLVRLRTAR